MISEAVRPAIGGARLAFPSRRTTLLGGRDWQLLFVALVALDVALLGVAVMAAGVFRLQLDGINPRELSPGVHSLASVLVLPVLIGLFWAHGLYDPDQILAGTREYAQIAHATTYSVFLALAASYFAGNSQFISRAWLVLLWVLCIGCVGIGRFSARRVVRRLRRNGHLRTRVAIVGASEFGVTIAEQLRSATDEGLDVVGFLDEYLPFGQPLLDGITVIGRPEDLLRKSAKHLADEFILVPQALPYERQEEISRLMASRTTPILRMAISSTDLLTHGARVGGRGNVPLVTIQHARIQGLESVWKRTFDLIGASLALVILAPALMFVLLRTARKRPLLRTYAISGAPGRDSRVWLFDRHVANGPLLRGAPALFAVLAGRLSLVGPRPTLCHSALLGSQPGGLTAVKSGLTGPWRLSGPGASREEQATQDLSYVHNYSIWEDIRILWESLRRLRSVQLTAGLARWE
jgi:lipopolysaccharide/colanic/teichoic acid biosynthesis glycosyltransferase